MPCTSESRPLKFDGPTLRQRNPATMEESNVCAESGAAISAAPTAARKLARCMTNSAEGCHPPAAVPPKDLLSHTRSSSASADRHSDSGGPPRIFQPSLEPPTARQ